MKKSIFGLLVLFGLLSAPHMSAEEGDKPNMSVKISPGLPYAGEPIVYEAVLEGDASKYQVGWWVWDPSGFFTTVSTNALTIPEPVLVYGLTFTNTFTEGGVKVGTVLIQPAGSTNGLESFIIMRTFAFLVQNGRDTSVTLTSPNGNEEWTAGNTYEIQWKKTGLASRVQISLDQRDNAKAPTIIARSAENSGSYSFTVPFGTNWVTEGTEGNLGRKNYRVVVAPIGIGEPTSITGVGLFGVDNGQGAMSDDWFTINAKTNPNGIPLSLNGFHFTEAGVHIKGATVGQHYSIESSADLKVWKSNRMFQAVTEDFSTEFPVSGDPSEFFRIVVRE